MFKFERYTPDGIQLPWWHDSANEDIAGMVHVLETGKPLSFDEIVASITQYNVQFPEAPILGFRHIQDLPFILIRLIECGACKVVGKAWWEEGEKKPVPSDELGDFY